MEKLRPLFKIIGVIAFWIRYRKTQYWSEKQIKTYQLKRIKRQLKRAKKVEYYQKLFKAINFDPERDFNQLEDLKKIPITSKQQVRSEPKQFINPVLRKFSFIFKTSGSTGNPMTFYIHPIHWIIEQAVIYRHWRWGGYRRRFKTAILRSYSPKPHEPLFKFSRILNSYYFSPFHMNDTNMLEYYTVMRRKRIRVLRGYPSSIKIFAEFLDRKQLNELNICLILTASEVLTTKDREFIERVFKTKISNHYGLAEQIVMFGDCENHTHLHNYFEYGYLELIDTEEPTVKKIIGTNLHNKTMPLLRYDTGDLAIVDTWKCNCERATQVVKNVIGRSDLTINCPNGYKIPSVNFYTMLDLYPKIKQWQIEYNDTIFLLKIDSGNTLNSNDHLQIEQDLDQRLLTSGFQVKIKETRDFLKINEGKIPTIISTL